MIMLLLAGCLRADGFLLNPQPLDAYALEVAVVPPDNVELVSFSSGDGTMLYGVWAWQDDPAAARTIVYFHGNGYNIDYHIERLDVYWSYGYNVFMLDYRGYGMSAGTPDEAGVRMDGLAAVVLVEETTGTPAADLLYFGTSLGGFVSANTAVAAPPRALIMEDTFSSAENLIATNAQVGLPTAWVMEGAWDTIAAVSALDGVPLLLIHGDSDTYITPEHATWLYSSAHDPRELWLVPGGSHGPVVGSVRHYELLPEEYRQHVSTFYDQWR